MGRHHAVVVVAGGDHDGWVGRAVVLDGVQWRVVLQVLEHLGAVVAAAIVGRPVPANGEEVVAQHVHHSHLWHCGTPQVGTLVHDGSHEQTAVAATVASNLALAGIALSDEPLGSGDEVVEDVLLRHLGARLVPLFAILATATQVGVGTDASLVNHGKWCARIAEAWVHRHVEAAISVEEHWSLAVLLHALLVDEEHGNLSAVLAGVEHLLGDVVLGIERHLGLEERSGLASAGVVAVDGAGEGVGGEVVEHLAALVLAAEAHRAQRGELDFVDLLATGVVEVGMSAGVAVVGDDELVVRHLNAAEHPLLLGDELGEVLSAQVVGIIGKHLVARRVLVGHDIDLAIVDANGREGKLAVVGNLHIVWIDALEVLDVERVALAGTLEDEDEALVLVNAHLVEEQRVVVAAELQVVVVLRCSQLVVHHLVPLVLRRLGVLGLVVGAVEESVAQPLRVGELSPNDVVVEHLASHQVVDDDLVPVAAVAGDGVGGIASVAREVEALERHCSVLAQGVGVEDHALLAVEAVLDVEHALVLQAVVLEVIDLVLHIERCSHLGIVGELGETCLHLVAEWDFLEVGLSDFVLGLYPLSRLGGVVVLEPSVWVGDLCAEVVVNGVDGLGLGVVDLLLRCH